MLQTSPRIRTTNPVPVDTPVHPARRRIKGLSAEVIEATVTITSTGMTSASVQTAPTGTGSTMSNRYTLESPWVLTTFHGTVFEDIKDWMVDFKHMAAVNEWNDAEKLRHIYFYLEDGACMWFQNREEQLTSWCEFCRQLLETYTSADRHERVERAIQAHVQLPNETVTTYTEDMTRLFRRVDPRMTDEKLHNLMRGVKEQLFAGLVWRPPKTVAEFLSEDVTMEKMLLHWSNLYERQVNSMSAADIFTAIGSNSDCLRELICSAVREELQKAAVTPHPTVSSTESIIKDELHQALHDTLPPDNAVAVPPEYHRATYAEALKRPASSPPLFVRAPPTESFQSAQPISYYDTGYTPPPFAHATPVAHRSSKWLTTSTTDARPLGSRMFGAHPITCLRASTAVKLTTCTASAHTDAAPIRPATSGHCELPFSAVLATACREAVAIATSEKTIFTSTTVVLSRAVTQSPSGKLTEAIFGGEVPDG